MSEAPPEGTNGGVIRWRIENQGTRLERIEEWRTSVDEDRTAIKGELQSVHRGIDDLKASDKKQEDALEALQKTLTRLLVGVVGSAITFSLTVLAATGKLG